MHIVKSSEGAGVTSNGRHFLSALSHPLHPQSSGACLTRAIGVSTWSIEDPHLESSRGPASHQRQA